MNWQKTFSIGENGHCQLIPIKYSIYPKHWLIFEETSTGESQEYVDLVLRISERFYP